jgi:arylsulfatase A
MARQESKVTRRDVLASITVAGNVPAGQPTASKSPNVVLILADNLSYGDVGCYGGIIRTPNIDRLANEGVRFTDAYAATVCSPSRSMLLTGRYPERVGLPTVIWPFQRDRGLPLDEITVADMFKAAGYKTACFGKWHLGHGPHFLPTKRGFDEFLGIPYSLDMPPCPLMDGTEIVEKEVDREGLPGHITERAVRFIDKHRTEPFFLYVPHTAPHPPLDCSQQFRGKSRAGIYGDVVEEMDWGIGRILSTLSKHRLSEKTLVIFTSDNGPYGNLGSAGGLRGVSYHTFEGGCREPFIARWPGRIPAGKVCKSVITLMDIVPTLAKLFSLKMHGRPVDGIDISPLLLDPAKSLERDALLYFDVYYNLQCARLGKYKLHISRHDYVCMFGPPLALLAERRASNRGSVINLPLRPPELYDLQLDPGECYNLADRHPDVVSRIQARVDALLQTLPEPVRTAYSDTQARKTIQEQGRLPRSAPT